MKLFISSVFVFCSVLSFGQNIELLGKWENSKEKISYEFRRDSSIIYTDGYSDVFISSYFVNYNTEPCQVSFVLSNGSAEMIIPAVLKFIGNDTLLIEQFTPFSKQTDFSDKKTAGRRQHKVFRQKTD